MRRDVRLAGRTALWWLLAPPAAILCVQLAWRLVAHASLPFSLTRAVLVTAATPVLAMAVRVGWRASQRRVDRRSGLRLFDRQLDLQDRLVTADEFLAANIDTRPAGDAADRFKRAAIADAGTHVARALQTRLAPLRLPPWRVAPRSWAAVPGAALALFAAFWIGGAPPGDGPAGHEPTTLAATLEALPARVVAALAERHQPRPRQNSRPPDERAEANDAKPSAEASTRSIRTDQPADGQSHAGGQASSRSSSRAMSSNGTPSNQQTPSKALEDDPPQDQKPGAPRPAKKADGRKAEPQETSATSGQGQSNSSSTDTSRIPASEQPDRAGASKDDGKDDPGMQDEVDEEKTAGVERPSLRKNKPPVDRNLSPRPAGDQANPNANGRSGPSGQKKTRGVPSMILGVPTPDRIQGMTNPGRSKVTQENSTPKEEPQADVAAEARAARERAFGAVEHPRLEAWMQSLIETYFTRIRLRR